MKFIDGFGELWSRITRNPADGDLEEEIRIHLQIETDENIASGMPPEQARYAAQKKFGNTLLHKEKAEEVWRFAWLDTMLRDFRYALRGLRKSPGFAVTVIGTLALGLGALAASISVFSTVVLRPYAVRDPYSLYEFMNWKTARGENSIEKYSFTRSELSNFRRNNPAFADVLAYKNGVAPVEERRANIQVVTGNYFNMLGGQVCLGRPLVESDDKSGEGVAVASYAAWKSRFGADPRVVGKKLRFGGSSVELVGVACPEFNGPQMLKIDFWASLSVSNELVGDVGVRGTGAMWRPDSLRLRIIGRLKPHLTQQSAEAALLAYGRDQYTSWDGWMRPPVSAAIEPRATIFPLSRTSISFFVPWILAFGLLLLIACANVSNMMLARGLARRREIGIRISLGAGRARMIRHLLAESLLLAIPSSLAGFGMAYVIVRVAYGLLMSAVPASLRDFALSDFNIPSFAPDLKVLAFLLVAAFITPLLFGLIPAVQTTRSKSVPVNRAEFESGRRPSRLRSTLVVVQATLCTLLLILSGVAMRNGMRTAALDLGLDVNGVFSIEFSERIKPDSVVPSLLSIPNLDSIGNCVFPPLKYPDWHYRFIGENGTIDASSATAYVSPEYFDVYKIPVRGRKSSSKFLQIPKSGAPDGTEVVISETTARRLWPGGDALGRTLEGYRAEDRSGSFKLRYNVVGIAQDSVYELLDGAGSLDPNRATVYFLGPPVQKFANFPTILVRMKGDPGTSRLLLEKALSKCTHGETDFKISNARDQWDIYLYPYRALAAIAGFLGVMALLMTTAGIFGMLSYVVTQRMKEFGIRIALGAGRARVTGLVFKQSLRLSAGGAFVGALMAFVVARVLGSHFILFDAGGYAAGVLILIAAALIASSIPAIKAVNLDPARTLHCD